jgi:NADH-quinone oxidoreductase subunit M
MVFPLLSAVLFSPLVGALMLACMPGQQVDAIRRAAFAFSLIPFFLSLLLLAAFDPANGGFQLVEQAAWIPSFGIAYHVGVDGISLFLVLLTTFLTPLVILFGWGDIEKRVKPYMIFLLLLETGILGAFVALDLFLFYVFWEVMLVPMVFIIGVWGGSRRIYAAIKFVLFTMSGSLLMLVAILYLAWQAGGGQPSFDLLRLYNLDLPLATQRWLFAAFALAFAIKVPMFPLHTWLPDAHVEAPTGGSVILAGVLLKLGTYGFLRYAVGLFPAVAVEAFPIIVAAAVIGIVYGALVAMVQPDLKKLVAYSSVSHLGFVMLGLFALNREGVAGSIYQMLNHGLSTGALFLLVGVIYHRRHTRLIADFGGLWKQLPLFSVAFLIVMLSSVGLPGLNGFVGEFLILLGAFRASVPAAAFAVSGVVLGAVYMLWMFQRVMFGPLDKPENQTLTDLSAREIVVLAPVLLMIVVMGVYPEPFLSRMQPAVDAFVARVERRAAASAHALRPSSGRASTSSARAEGNGAGSGVSAHPEQRRRVSAREVSGPFELASTGASAP